MTALVAGATGYVGSALVPALLKDDVQVYATSRSLEKLAARPWADDITMLELDLLQPVSLPSGLDVAYYLVHSLEQGDYESKDLQAAKNFGAAAARAGVKRIVYLGGLVPPASEAVSRHLSSRDQVGQTLSDSGVDTVRLQAAAIIGAGSTPFELMRHLVGRFKVVPLPAFMSRPMQPIGIDDVVYYLIAAASRKALPAGRYDITTDQVTTYAGLVRTFAETAGLRRVFVPVPLVPPQGAAAMIGPITPLDKKLVANLMPSLANTMVSTDRRIRDYIPDPLGGLMDLRECIAQALAQPEGASCPPA